MPNRRAHWVETAIQKEFVDATSRYDALSLLGVSKKRYYFAEDIYLVNEYEEIAPTLSSIYATHRKKNNGRPIQYSNPVVLSRVEPRVLNSQEVILPGGEEVSLFEGLEEYESKLESNTNWQKVVLPGEGFKRLPGQFLGDDVYVFEEEIPSLKGFLTETNVYENLCTIVSDEKGNYYYPLSGDIFNFRPHKEASNAGYSIPYEFFYATYLDQLGKTRLFVRRSTTLPALEAMTFEVNAECDKDPRFNLPLNVEERSIRLEPRDFNFYEDYENKYAIHQTSKLSAEGIPSYLGGFVNRITLENQDNFEALNWFSTDSSRSEVFTLENELLYLSKEYESDPYISSEYKAKYTVLDRDIYNAMDELEITAETPDKVTLKTKRAKSALLVTRNTFSHDWVAKVDGQKSRTYVVNGLYLATGVPEGEHVVEFEYRPEWFKMMMKLMPIYGLLIPGLIVYQRLFGWTHFLKIKNLLVKDRVEQGVSGL